MMHPTVALGAAALAWLFVHNWSGLARVLLAVAAMMLGWEPASRGDWVGFLLVSIASGVAVSVLWEELAGFRVRQQPRPQPLVAAAAGSGMPMPTAPEGNDPLTELERAEWYSDLLDVNIAGLEEAKRNGDLRAQAAFAGEIEDLASEMREMLRVVLGERHRIAN